MISNHWLAEISGTYGGTSELEALMDPQWRNVQRSDAFISILGNYYKYFRQSKLHAGIWYRK